jgi:hypothetical protein
MLKIKRKLNELAWTCIFLFQFYKYESVKPNSPAGFKSSFFAASEHWWNFYHRRITLCSCEQLCKFEGMHVCTFCTTFPTFLLLEQTSTIAHHEYANLTLSWRRYVAKFMIRVGISYYWATC